MKTTLLAFFVLTGMAFEAQSNIPDVNFELALIDYGIDTNGLNGNILNSDAQSIKTITIFNITGKVIKNLEGNFRTIDVSELSQGMYVFKIQTDSNLFTKKIIKN